VLRMAIIAVLVLVLAEGTARRASADPWEDVDCSQNAGPGCDLAVGDDGAAGGSGGGPAHAGVGDAGSGNDGLECRYEPVDYRGPEQPAGPGGWFMVLCSPDGKDPLSHGPVWVAAGAGGVPELSPEQVAQIARKRLRLPPPRIAASPTGDQLVNLPTWLWLSDGWRPMSASASVPGVSVTAVATPTSVSWAMGDGSTVNCAGPGTPYLADADPKSASPDCGYVYRRSSAGQPGNTFHVTANVRWTVTWSGAGRSGAFPGLTTSATATYRVAESQALGTG
jgi:hypothetical protein